MTGVFGDSLIFRSVRSRARKRKKYLFLRERVLSFLALVGNWECASPDKAISNSSMSGGGIGASRRRTNWGKPFSIRVWGDVLRKRVFKSIFVTVSWNFWMVKRPHYKLGVRLWQHTSAPNCEKQKKLYSSEYVKAETRIAALQNRKGNTTKNVCKKVFIQLQRSSERRAGRKKRSFGTTPFKQKVILKNCNHFGQHLTVKNRYIQV